MPNVLDSTGLTIVTKDETVTALTTGYQQIYGTDISTDSDTPDGQQINLFAQAIQDTAELILSVFSSFDPDFAVGEVLDQRVAINGIQRQAGTYTITPITLVNSQSVTIYGLDQSVQPVYTVADAAGNLWELQVSQLGLAAGSHILNFRAASPGAVTTTPNTITVQVTIVLGVTSVNNPTTYTTLGINEESDAALRIRRSISVSLASQGYLAGLLAALENISGMTAAFVFENNTGSTDANGVPGHSIWVITSGTAAPVDIAQAIYDKRNAGCGMKGSQLYNYPQVDGTTFPILWDDVIPINLFISFTVTSLNGVNVPNIAAIRPGLVTSFVPGVAAEVNVNALATQVQIIDPNTLVTNAGFATGRTQILNMVTIAASGTFALTYNGNSTAAINWNDSVSTIQTKLRAVTGLAAANVTGSIASQTLTLDLTALASVAALIYVTSNTLMTALPVPVLFTYNYGFTATLTPSSKQYQFVVSAANILIIPVELLPATSQVTHSSGTVAFASYGGYGSYAYSFQTNNSGGTINSATGAYAAGATPLVTDTVLVTDVLGKTATATVTVT